MNNCVYKIENLINGKIYIGSTNNFARRMREHKAYVTCSSDRVGYNKPLYRSFRKRGLENFDFSIIVDNIESLTLARKIEAQKIQEYDCLFPKGYNLKENTEGLSEQDINHLIEINGIKCALIDENEQIITKYRSLREAGRNENCDATSISNVCKGLVYKTKGKLFRFLDKDENIIEIEPKYNLRYSEICSISMFDYSDIEYFNSVKEAAEKYNVTKDLISKCIQGNTRYKQVKERIWRRVDKGNIIENDIDINKLIEEYNKKYILYKGERKTLSEWANSIGLSSNGLKHRLLTMSFEEAMSIPPKNNSLRYTGQRIKGR
jgi:hypothetical protein